jgi:nitrate reductase (NAD(P)H)
MGDKGHMGWREEDNLVRAALDAAAPPPAPVAAAPVAAAPAAAAPAAAPAAKGSPAVYTMEEVAQHTSEDSCWFVHDGKVYNATPYLAEHPGGPESIMIVAGGDATDEFNSIHSSKVGHRRTGAGT